MVLSLPLRVQVWRLITPFFILGRLDFNAVIQMVWIYTYGTSLESNTYSHNPAEYLFAYLFCGAFLLFTSFITPYTFLKGYVSLPIMAPSMVFVLIHLYSRNNPDQGVSIWGLMKIRSFYLPFAFSAIKMIMGGDIVPDLCGIMAAHVFYWLTDLYPRATGRQVMRTPALLQRLLANQGIGFYRPPAPRPNAATPAAPAAAAAASGFRAFQGSGRRLAD